MPKTRISDNPRSWSTDTTNGTALLIEGKMRNLSPIAAYIGTADYNAPIIEVIPGESHLPGGAETAVDVFVASTGGEISLMSEPIRLRYSSMASGEEAVAVAHVHGAGTIAGPSSGGSSPYELAFKGWTAITTGDEAPRGEGRDGRVVATGPAQQGLNEQTEAQTLGVRDRRNAIRSGASGWPRLDSSPCWTAR
jgi:hypothetical protein